MVARVESKPMLYPVVIPASKLNVFSVHVANLPDLLQGLAILIQLLFNQEKNNETD